MLKAYKLKSRFQEGDSDRNEGMLWDTLYEDIFNCGKNLALLKICNPQVNFTSNSIEQGSTIEDFILKMINLNLFKAFHVH